MSHKLYIFGIGGTGSRVIKSLAMLLAAGCKLENEFDTIIPIIIDPDTSNGDLNRTKDILRLYQEIRNQVHLPDDFFKQEIKTINELADNSSVISPEYFQFKLTDVETNTFGQYIGFDTLSEKYKNSADDKSFIRALYSQSNLESKLNVGFKGNPNMGSIVLNQFTKSEDFKKFGRTFAPGDAIFIINSIFGGTGAAGFPLLLKNLRGNDQIPNAAQIMKSKIGDITYLPYFALDGQGEINHNSFDEKAKIALDYYTRTIISQDKVNLIYFLGNKGNTNSEAYAVGGTEQKNRAHFLEIVGALAIMDFVKSLATIPEKTQVKEFGIETDNDDELTFNDLNIENARILSAPLTKYRLFTEYLNKGLSKALDVSRWTKSNIWLVRQNKESLLDSNYFSSTEYKNQVKAFNDYFTEWIGELEQNKPAFSPFNHITIDNALELVKQYPPKGNSSFKALDTENCLLIDKTELRPIEMKKHTTLIKLFGLSTDKIAKSRNILIR